MGKRLSEENCLENKFPELIKEWDFDKNVNLKPFHVSYSSNKKSWWICKNCHESYCMQISHKTKGKGCPYCSGKKVCNWNCLATKFPDIAKQWHPTLNNDLTAYDITPGSHNKVWWICYKCNEVYDMIVCNKKR